MSIAFNDTSTRNGLIQLIERNLKLGNGRISGDTELLKDFTADINVAFDDLLRIIFTSDNTWQFDDSTHTDYPIITTNLVANQRDYSFTTDEQGNVILDIFKVAVKDSATGEYYDVSPVDMQSEDGTQSFYDGSTTTGKVSKYDKTGNGIFFDVLPEESITGGIKIFINREGMYFTYTDTTKKAGVDGLCQKFLALAPCYAYAMRNSLDNKNDYKRDLNELTKEIKQRYSDRQRDVKKVIKPKYRSVE